MSGRRADVPALTGVRALAALWVVAYHGWLATGRPAVGWPGAGLPWRLDPLFASGWLGVDVFFVLSGFVLQWQVEHERDAAMLPWRGPGSYGRFLGRRVLRVFPAYLACLTVLLPLAWLRVGRWTPPEFADTALHLVMTHNAVPAYVSTISGVFWSLPLEWHFYLVFPLGAWLLSRSRGWPLLALAFAVTALVHWLAMNRQALEWLLAWTPFRAIEFATGMAGAAWVRRSRVEAPAHADALFAAGTLVLVALSWYWGRHDIAWWTGDWRTLARMTVMSAAVTAMLCAVSLPAPSRVGTAVFGNRIAVWIGMVSYSLYLWHHSIMEFVAYFRIAPIRGDASMRDLASFLAVALPLSFAISAVSYHAIERVFLDRTRWPVRDGDRAGWMRRPLLVIGAWMLALLAAAALVALVRR